LNRWYRRPVARVVIAVLLSTAGLAVLGGGLLALMEGAEQAGRRLTHLSPGWVALAVLVWSGSLPIQGLRWRALLPGTERPPVARLAWVIFGANALTLALPGPVGEFGAAWYLRHRYGIPMVTALAATLLARAVALLVFGLATLALWPLVAASLPADLVRLVTPIAVLTGVVTLPILGLCWRPAAMVGWVGGVLARVLPARFAERVATRVDWWVRCFTAVGAIPAHRWLQAAGYSFANLCLLTASTLCSMYAAGIPCDPLGTLFVQALTAVASVAGVLVPGGFGAVELLLVALFPTFAEGTAADAVFAAITLRWVHLLTLLAGVPAMAWLVATLPGEPEALAPVFAERLREELA